MWQFFFPNKLKHSNYFIINVKIAHETHPNQAQITWDIFMNLLMNFIRRSKMTHLILLNSKCRVRSKQAITLFLFLSSFKLIFLQVLCCSLYYFKTDSTVVMKTFFVVCIHCDRWRNCCCDLKFGGCQSLVISMFMP